MALQPAATPREATNPSCPAIVLNFLRGQRLIPVFRNPVSHVRDKTATICLPLKRFEMVRNQMFLERADWSPDG